MRKYIFFITPVIILCGAIFFYLMFNVVSYQNDYSPETSEYIFVLGHALDGGERPSKWLIERMREGIRLYNLDYADKILVSGGRTGSRKPSVALVMKNWLMSEGVPEDDIIMEESASNTYENFKFAREIIGDRAVIIVTNDFHMYRSMIIAEDFFSDISGSSAPIPGGVRKILAYCKEPLSIIKYSTVHRAQGGQS